MTRLAEIRDLYAFNRWANALVLDAVSALTDAELTRDLRNSFPSVRDTLVHVLSAEWVWLQRLRGRSPTALPEEWRHLGVREMRARWREVERDWLELLDALSEGDLDRRIAYRNTAGEPFESAQWQILRHCVNHSTYHRGQVTTMLRQLGAKPPTTDLIRWFRGT